MREYKLLQFHTVAKMIEAKEVLFTVGIRVIVNPSPR